MKKFVMIDGNALIHRSYHALPKTLRTPTGVLVNAVHGFVGILLGILETEHPDYIATAWDMKGPTFRDELMVGYKGTRKKTDDELIGQFPLVYGVLETLSVPMFKKQGLEADDYLGIVAKILEDDHKDVETVIVTSDQDAFQLVRKNTTVVTPISGYRTIKRYDKMAVKEKLGVWPEQVTDYKGLCGDSSDNIKGVPGIGKKTAVALLEQFDHLEALYENLEAVERKSVREKLITHREEAFTSKTVATILRQDAQLDFKIEDCTTHSFDIEAVRELFAKLAFNTHMRRVENLNRGWEAQRVAEQQGSLF
ncbi:MAG: DNA polymerase-1 [Oceanicoccus sp.]|jgi:DNA polymerase-1